MSVNWLEERRNGIGGSDIAIILGLSKYKSLYQLTKEKLEGCVDEDNPYKKRGKRQESLTAQIFEEETGYKVLKPTEFKDQFPHIETDNGVIFYHPSNSIFRASLDGFFIKNDELCVWEGKYTELPCENIDPAYFMQLQWYLGVTGLEFGVVYYSHRGLDYIGHEFSRDDETIELLQAKAQEYWDTYIIPKVLPSPSTVEDMKAHYPVALTGKQLEVNEEDFRKTQRYRELNESIFPLNEEKEQIKSYFISKLEDVETVIYNGVPVATYKTDKTGSFLTAKFKKDYPDLYQKYLGQPSRRLLFKEYKNVP